MKPDNGQRIQHIISNFSAGKSAHISNLNSNTKNKISRFLFAQSAVILTFPEKEYHLDCFIANFLYYSKFDGRERSVLVYKIVSFCNFIMVNVF